MKTSIASLFLLVFTACLAQAGSFGGPPPFTNGSPLISGVDGTYQASIRGSNLTGIVEFTYADGVQAITVGSNEWVIFYEGQVMFGQADVAIDDGSITGVLEGNGTSPVGSENFRSDVNEIVSVITTLTPATGYFNGSLDNNSPNGSFNAKGEIASIVTTDTSYTNLNDSSLSYVTTTTSVLSVSIKVKGVRITT